jgi:hypothetical protein
MLSRKKEGFPIFCNIPIILGKPSGDYNYFIKPAD